MSSEANQPEPITELLLKKMAAQQLLKDDDISFLLETHRNHRNTPIAEIILKNHLMTEKQLLRFLSSEFDCTPIDPTKFKIHPENLQLIPPNIAHRYRILPISRKNNVLSVAMENPVDLRLIDDVRALTGLRVRAVISLPESLKKAIEHHYPSGHEGIGAKTDETIEDLIRIVQESKAEEGEGGTAVLLQQAQETPVIKVANLLMIDAVRRKASDLFVEPWENSLRVRCRVDGLLEEIPSPPKAIGQALVSRFKVMSRLDIAERRIPQDGRIKVKVQGREVDFRVSTLPTPYGEKVCLRILDKKATTQSLDDLGFTEREVGVIKESAVRPHGMILVTGPTGSGKTTTLYSILHFLDSPEKNITTVEDPIEYETDGIAQVNVRDAIGLTFSAALRSILRQDPDIILIGEIRDAVTMDTAIKAALTGHLVLSTLHTNDAAGSLVRMRNMGMESFLIASSVIMVSAQRLLRRLCGECKAPFEPEQALLTRLKLDPNQKHVFYRPVGCEKCRQSGYAGRTVITELLPLTAPIKEMIMKNETGEAIKRHAKASGMTTLRECGLQKALQGATSLDEVFRLTTDDQDLKEL